MSSKGWNKYKLGEFAKLIKNQYQPTADEELIYIGLEHIEQQSLSINGTGNSKNVISQKYRFSNGDILFGKLRPYFRKVFRPNFDGVCSTDIWVINSKNGFDQGFLFYFLANQSFIDACNSGSSGTRMPRADWGHLSETEWSIPPLPTQRRIADILSSLDDKIELNRQTNATLEAIAQAIFKEWFVDFNFPGATGEMVESDLGLIPKGWRVAQLGEVSDLLWGDTTTTKRSYTTEGYLAYSASGPDGYLPYYDFSRQGIVVSAIGAYSGKTWFAQGNWSCIKNTIRLWSIDDHISNEYLFLYTSGKDFWPLRGSAQPFISQTNAREIKIIYPGNHLSSIFGEIIQPVFQLIRRNDDESITFSHTRDLLLPKLMNGEIEV